MAKSEKVRIQTAVGRLIHSALFEKDVYKNEKGQEGKPVYRVELAFDGDEDVKELEDAVVDAAVAEWGDKAADEYWDGKIASPIHTGDDLAAKREKKGKSGDAYRGKLVIRASTQFNKNGDDAPGGTYVCDENAVELDFAERGKVYNGCYGIAVVEPSAYTVSGERGVTLYLQGFQFVKDGERLRGISASSLFKPLAAPSAATESKGRRRRG